MFDGAAFLTLNGDPEQKEVYYFLLKTFRRATRVALAAEGATVASRTVAQLFKLWNVNTAGPGQLNAAPPTASRALLDFKSPLKYWHRVR